MTSEFIFEDSEIPDLVLETIIGFLVEATPIEKWGEIRSVSKRWNRISKPVLKEAFERAWPKFILPRKPGTAKKGDRQLECAKLTFKPSLVEVSLQQDEPEYRYAFVRPLPLRSIRGPVGLTLTQNDTGGIYFSVFLMHSSSTNLLDHEVQWDPGSCTLDDLASDGTACCCSLGACSGQLFNRSPGAETPASNNGSADDGKPVDVIYYPGGRVVFRIDDARRYEGKLKEKMMIQKHGDDAILVFAVGIGSNGRRVLLNQMSNPPP